MLESHNSGYSQRITDLFSELKEIDKLRISDLQSKLNKQYETMSDLFKNLNNELAELMDQLLNDNKDLKLSLIGVKKTNKIYFAIIVVIQLITFGLIGFVL